jgi:hypothetical protein
LFFGTIRYILKFLHLMEPFVYFLNFVFVLNFSIFPSYPVSVRGSMARFFLLVLHRKLMRAPETPSTGLQKAPEIFKIFPPKQHLHESRSKPQVRGYNSCCGKSNSPAPLTGSAHYAEPRKSKNSTRNRNFKSKRTRFLCVGTSNLWIDTKNICANLVRLSL